MSQTLTSDDPVPPADGLTTTQAAQRRATAGWNVLPTIKPPSKLRILLRQFTGFLVLILIVAALLAMALGERIDALAIGVIVVLNGVLGFVQEWRAERALDSLRKMLSPTARVVRDGIEQVLPARELVPGDLIVLEAGDSVPADAQARETLTLRVDESVLTGESIAVEKGAAAPLFAGTHVVAGRAEALVTAIGSRTEFGQIAEMTGALDRTPTPLQVQLGRLGAQLGIAALLIALAITLAGVLTGRDLIEMVLTGVSLAVAIVPEGLPAVVTVTLALGAAAMVRQKALARRLQAVETLGAASVICTDKTGTLTENKMTATRIWTPTTTYQVTGTGYDPTGHIEADGQKRRAADDPVLAQVLNAGMICSHSSIRQGPDGWEMVGDPTEGALVTLAYKGWCPLHSDDDILAELPFSSDRKRMSVLVEDADGPVTYTKGAPEQIVEICTQYAGQGPLDAAAQAQITAAYEDMARQGFRVIALALRRGGDAPVEAEMTFLGLVGMIDPPRAEVKGAIAQALSAGIRIVMITGDSPVTAAAIAREVGLGDMPVVTGGALSDMDDATLSELLQGGVLFARTRPGEKMRIVSALQAQGQIVAMTGDGVNDAPALRQSDIGIAMGIRGTDVAKGAADLVLLDDNFATIVAAIREGRRQYENLRKFVRYLLSSNAGEVVAIVTNILIGGPLIFLATQILWMNLVTDGLTAMALGLEKTEADQMDQPPRGKGAGILGRNGLLLIVCFGLYTGAASLWVFWQLLAIDVELARTAAFTAMVIFEKFSVFAFRSLRAPCWRIGYFSNPALLAAFALAIAMQLGAVYWGPLQVVLHTVPLGWDHWSMILMLAVPLLIVPELIKSLWNRAAAARSAHAEIGHDA